MATVGVDIVYFPDIRIVMQDNGDFYLFISV